MADSVGGRRGSPSDSVLGLVVAGGCLFWFTVWFSFESGFWSGFSGQVLGLVLGRFRSRLWWFGVVGELWVGELWGGKLWVGKWSKHGICFFGFIILLNCILM